MNLVSWSQVDPGALRDAAGLLFQIVVLMAVVVKSVEVFLDMLWSIRVGNRFARAVNAEVTSQGDVDVLDIEGDFRRLQPVYAALDRLWGWSPSLARALRAVYWAPGLATMLLVASALSAPVYLAVFLATASSIFTILVLVNAPLRRFALRGSDRYNRDLLFGAWVPELDNRRIRAEQAARNTSAYLLWLVYVSVLGFASTYQWLSVVDPTAFSPQLDLPLTIYYSLSVVSTVGFVAVVPGTPAAQLLVALQVSTGPLILAWLLTEVLPHQQARRTSNPKSENDLAETEAQRTLVAGLLVSADGRCLLALRGSKSDFRPAVWDLIGGHVEPSEDPWAAVVREVYEEVGVEIKESARPPRVRWIENGYDLRIWIFRDWIGKPKNYARGQHSRIEFFDPSQAKRLNLGDQKYRVLFSELQDGVVDGDA